MFIRPVAIPKAPENKSVNDLGSFGLRISSCFERLNIPLTVRAEALLERRPALELFPLEAGDRKFEKRELSHDGGSSPGGGLSRRLVVPLGRRVVPRRCGDNARRGVSACERRERARSLQTRRGSRAGRRALLLRARLPLAKASCRPFILRMVNEPAPDAAA